MQEAYADLTAEQKHVVDVIKTGKSVVIHGPAGTGKSHIIQFVTSHLYANNQFVAVTATTGIAALSVGGVTLHSWMGCGLARGAPKDLIKRIHGNASALHRWMTTKILIVDEISMLSKDLFEKIDALAKLIRNNIEVPFGGMQLVLSGDFFQLPPVGRYLKDRDAPYCFESGLWKHMVHSDLLRICELQTNKRQASDPEFASILDRLRVGQLTPRDFSILETRLTKSQREICYDPCYLTPLIREADALNQENFDKFTNKDATCKYKGHVDFKVEENAQQHKHSIEIEYKKRKALDFLKSNLPVPEHIQLRVGAKVMLRINTDIARGLVNGARGTVVRFENDLPVVKFPNYETPVRPHTWMFTIKRYGTICFTQLPLILAWALTIHKSQSLTLDCVRVNVGKTLFAPGHAYTAISRVRRLQDLFIDDLSFEACTKLNNKVLAFYKENIERSKRQKLN